MTINTLYELVRNSVEKFASKVAFSMFEGDDVTYAEVGRRIEKVQEILTGAGLRAGDKVALLSSNMPNWGVCYFAVTSAGMVAVPILPDFSGEELDMIIAHSEAKALLVSDRLFTKLSKQTIERLNVVVRTKNLGVIAQRVRGEGTMAVPKPDDLAVIIYTSGTTSKPKGVMLTHAALCAQVGISSGIFPVLPDDVFLSVLPLSHTYECSIGMIDGCQGRLPRPSAHGLGTDAGAAGRASLGHADRAAHHREDLPPPGAGQIQFQRFLADAL